MSEATASHAPNPWGVPPPPVGTESAFFNAARTTTFLLVEGGSDRRFWEQQIDRHACQVREYSGRKPALAELEKVIAQGHRGFVAVLDADFDRLEGGPSSRDHVVWTDLHDLETMLVFSSALGRVLVESASTSKLTAFASDRPHEQEQAVRDRLQAHGVKLGRLRWLSLREGLSLQFRKHNAKGEISFLPYEKFCEEASFDVDETAMVQAALNFSQRHDLKLDELQTALAALPAVDDPRQLCVGHDLIGFLQIGLRKKLGSQKRSREELEKDLRQTYRPEDLRQTQMYQQLQRWEQDNPPFRIFKRPAEG